MDLLLADIDKVLAALKKRAFERGKMTPTIGRSHAIHAEPVTGLKLAVAPNSRAPASASLPR